MVSRREMALMAVRRVPELVDDLDGAAAAETVQFGLDGTGYELDLSAANAAALRGLPAGYLNAARRVGAARRRPPAAAHARPGQPAARRPGTAAATPPAAAPAAEPGPGRADPTGPTRPALIGLAFSDRHANGTANG